ncbi:hypothetical protein GQ457_15G006110 [Hibiscus cannabinus]
MAASGVSAPTRTEVLHLYRSLLRVARQFCDYNIREYTKRRTVDAIRDNKNLTDPSQLAAAFSDGKAQLEVAKRQALVYSLYAPKVVNIFGVTNASHSSLGAIWISVVELVSGFMRFYG